MTQTQHPPLQVGDVVSAVLVEDLKRTQIVQYAGASGDFNALHTDERYAREIGGFPGVFAHGMLTMALTGRLITDTLGIQRLTHFGGRFTAQVWPGDTLTAELTVIAKDSGSTEVSVRTSNQTGAVVFEGTASARP